MNYYSTFLKLSLEPVGWFIYNYLAGLEFNYRISNINHVGIEL